MASLCDYPNGYRVMSRVGERRAAIWLGRVGENFATSFRTKVERIERALLLGEPFDVETSLWLKKLPDDTHAKLSRIGLVAQGEKRQLGPWLEKYLCERERDLKPASRKSLFQNCSS